MLTPHLHIRQLIDIVLNALNLLVGGVRVSVCVCV